MLSPARRASVKAIGVGWIPASSPEGGKYYETRRVKGRGLVFPSDCVKGFTKISGTALSIGGSRYGRLSDRFEPPTALFSGALAPLKLDLEHLETFTPSSRLEDKPRFRPRRRRYRVFRTGETEGIGVADTLEQPSLRNAPAVASIIDRYDGQPRQGLT